jgi:hypothetical protein
VDDYERGEFAQMGGLMGQTARPEDSLAELDREAHRHDAAADTRDDQAKAADRDADARDRVAETRDDRASRRDAAEQDEIGGAGRTSRSRSAARDREASAGDRISAVEDRERARRHRKASRDDRSFAAAYRGAAADAAAVYRTLVERAEDNAEDMLLIGQAQGILMVSHDLSAAQALLEIYTRANRDRFTVSGAAQSIVEDLDNLGSLGQVDTGA